MKNKGNGFMGKAPEMGAAEVTIPYNVNRNERDVEEGDERTDLPKWEIWDWLEANVPDLHKQDAEGNDCGPVSWLVFRRLDLFEFYFEDHNVAMRFKLTFAP